MINSSNVANLDRINLRLTAETFQAIDAARVVRPGRISRNTWIAEAIEEKLMRDAHGASGAIVSRAGNA